jgi:glycosyltransferase involved in cell wall biosynthesis
MSVHNGMPWLAEAVQSVLGQSVADLELVIVDDGSTDGTADFLAGLDDPRVEILRQPQAGLTRALNRALARARGALVARLDADDVTAPDRLARQLAFLDAHPEVGLLGTGAREVDAGGREVRVVRPPAGDGDLRRALIRENPFVHSSVMLRRELVQRVGGYDERLAVAQDYDLWLRLAHHTRLATLPEPLVTRRLVPGRVSAVRDADRLRTEARCRLRAVARGDYPWWYAALVLRPLLALALPGPLRRRLRALRDRWAAPPPAS